MSIYKEFGRRAKEEGLFVGEAMGRYGITGLENQAEFYEGYMGSGWKVEIREGRIHIINRTHSP